MSRLQNYYLTDEFLEKFKYSNGPIVYRNNSIEEYDAQLQLMITEKQPCFIDVITTNSITRGLGCYFGYGHVLTALHVIKDVIEENPEILSLFYTEKSTNALIYKACFTKSCNTDLNRDQAFIKLFGDTTPLGPGLQNHIGNINDTDNGYFYTSTPDGNFQKQEGKIICLKQCTDAFLISVAGKPGDSGSPVYNAKDEMIGIYRGVKKESKYGIGSAISQQFLPWV